MFGKWHLGNGPEYHPARRGFDEAIVSNGRHFDFATSPSVAVEPGKYLADFLTDQAVSFIDRHAQEPFLLYLPHFAVHSPWQAKPELVEKFKSKTPAGGHNDPTYAAMIASLDESVGRIVAALDKHQLADNTLLIFTSDNGGLGGYRVPGTDRTKGVTDNAPLRAGKGALYEGGIRVPFLARWPAVIQPGTSCDAPIAHVDMFPTFLQIAGVEPDAGVTLDGVGVADLFRAPDTALDRDAIYWHFPGYLESYIPEATWRTTPVSVVRTGDYKLLEFLEDGRVELYNLNDDLGERHNLAAKMPERVERLRRQLAHWRKETHAAPPRMKTPDELAHPVDPPRKRRKAASRTRKPGRSRPKTGGGEAAGRKPSGA
jgi:arylsulfatase A-like enzyme